MPLYKAQFLDHGDKIFGVSHFEAEHDKAALKHVSELCPMPIGKGYEVWQGARLVHKKAY